MALGAIAALVLPALPTLLELARKAAGIEDKSTAGKVLGIVGSALQGLPEAIEAGKAIAALFRDDAPDPTPAEIDAVIRKIDGNSESISALVRKIEQRHSEGGG